MMWIGEFLHDFDLSEEILDVTQRDLEQALLDGNRHTILELADTT